MAKRLIDADKLKRQMIAFATGTNANYLVIENIVMMINQADTVDAVEVIRCRDGKHWSNHSICEVHSEWPDQYNTGHSDYTEPDDFCSHGERKGGEGWQREKP